MPTDTKTTSELMQHERARIFLQPIASPWVLGLFGYSIAAFVMGGKYAGWFNGAGANAMVYVAIAALLGGFAQFISAMWAFKARDVLSTAFNGIWGTFWLVIGFLNLFAVQTATAATATQPAAPVAASMGGIEMGFFFIPLTMITAACVAASLNHSKGLISSLVLLTVASVVMTIGLLAGSIVLQMIGGWCFVVSTAFAWYSATLSLVSNSYASARGRVKVEEEHINEGLGEPGVVHDIGAKLTNLTTLRRAGANK
jgi:succinate-acetate transporter protein